MRYLECNPVRARLVRLAWRYPWSSAAAHIGEPDTSGVLDLRLWRQHWAPQEWAEVLRERQADQEVAALRSSTRRGRPLATDSFLSKLERRLGRRLRALPVGRPARKKRARNARGREK